MNAINESAPADIKNCILVHAVNGRAVHSFVTMQEGRDALGEIAKARGFGSIFQTDSVFDAEMLFGVSPQLRVRVEEAKVAIRKGLEWKSALDKHNVPTDPELRQSIHRAIQDILNKTIASAILREDSTIQ